MFLMNADPKSPKTEIKTKADSSILFLYLKMVQTLIFQQSFCPKITLVFVGQNGNIKLSPTDRWTFTLTDIVPDLCAS